MLEGVLALGADLYAYVTLTTPSLTNLHDDMKRFMDQLQRLDANLPLRTVPLQIKKYTPTTNRLRPDREEALKNQFIAARCWSDELAKRFTPALLNANIADIPLLGRQLS